MFDNLEKNVRMLEGAYRKLKSYYFYSKNFLMMREKIAQFESNDEMEETFIKLAQALALFHSGKDYVSNLIDKISFYSLPKNFAEGKNSASENPLSNREHKDKQLVSVNFFIDAPIELHILDTLWTTIVGKAIFENSMLSSNVYGNTIADMSLYSSYEEINFASTKLFNPYFYKYSEWRNNAFALLEKRYDEGESTILISLDVKSFFYCVDFDFDLTRSFGDVPLVGLLSRLTLVIEEMYHKYRESIILCRHDISDKKNSLSLPIGLHSSMVIANLYLRQFDRRVSSVEGCKYYGRYVDDLLLCFECPNDFESTSGEIIESFLTMNGILEQSDSSFNLAGYPNLKIQENKVKVLIIDANEPKAILDYYKNHLRVVPSQANILPDYSLELENLSEAAYTFDSFANGGKIRDLDNLRFDAFRISKFFSVLPLKQILISSDEDSKTAVKKQISEIDTFFEGSQALEFSANWINYLYYLVLCNKFRSISSFFKKISMIINGLSENLSQDENLSNIDMVVEKTKESLSNHLTIAVATALAIDLPPVSKNKRLEPFLELARNVFRSNMFNHQLVSLPLINYFEYSEDISYITSSMSQYGMSATTSSGKGLLTDTFKTKWNPRFIHIDELWQAYYFYGHSHKKEITLEMINSRTLFEKFYELNGISTQFEAFKMSTDKEKIKGYTLSRIAIPDVKRRDELTVVVANVKMDKNECLDPIKHPERCLTRKKRIALNDLLRETFRDSKGKADLVVFPELFLPAEWLRLVTDFAKRAQIAVVVGLQYTCEEANKVKNSVAVILPYRTGYRGKYKNTFLFVREKNDYSPIEKIELAKLKKKCFDADEPVYQVFKWRNFDLSTFLCFEFTDVTARALLKGECDVVCSPVFNTDTTYFSNIIDSSVRDMHAIVVQSNNSTYGDSRITAPYDRDSKDILKIKGGENDHMLVGVINIKKVKTYQKNYHPNLDEDIKKCFSGKKLKKRMKTKPEIKKLPARYK